MVSIRPFSDALAPAFHSINAAWITTMFTMDPHDQEVLTNPRHWIIDKGGIILFAVTDHGEPIGAGALMPTEPGAVELTKMGVLDRARGTGAGGMLLDALITHARAMPGIETLYLLTNRKCKAAIHLYEKAGFVHDASVMARFGGDYCRCDVAMRYPL